MGLDIRDGMKIGGMEVVVAPSWLVRRMANGEMAILLPQEAADKLRGVLKTTLSGAPPSPAQHQSQSLNSTDEDRNG